MSDHYVEKCRECQTVMSQCRCPSNDKQVKWATCEKCERTQSLRPPSDRLPTPAQEASEPVTAQEALKAFRWWRVDAPDAHGAERHIVRRFLEAAAAATPEKVLYEGAALVRHDYLPAVFCFSSESAARNYRDEGGFFGGDRLARVRVVELLPTEGAKDGNA